MNKFNPHHLLRRGLFDPLTVCEEPLYKPCITDNKTRIGCVLKECCYSMGACYKKRVPDHVIALYSAFIIVVVLLWAILGLWFFKYRRLKNKLDDILGQEESSTELDTGNTSQKTEEQVGTNKVEKRDDVSGLHSDDE
ncbi:testis-expressed protein 29 [Ranitomeya variabilis]|uniref:testis-expressed protein 29 n=1 Tax=Ranitomeya variabilis TaxID=490064 RepID=UPI0040577424